MTVKLKCKFVTSCVFLHAWLEYSDIFAIFQQAFTFLNLEMPLIALTLKTYFSFICTCFQLHGHGMCDFGQCSLVGNLHYRSSWRLVVFLSSSQFHKLFRYYVCSSRSRVSSNHLLIRKYPSRKIFMDIPASTWTNPSY